jgi:hypothetical protein
MKLKVLSALIALTFFANAQGCDLNSASPLSAKLPALDADQPPRQVVISNNVQLQLPQADGLIKMHSADSARLIDELTHWPTPSGSVGSIKAQPVVLDQDYDGVADAIYLVDTSGQLWFVPLSRDGFGMPRLIADLTAVQAQFTQPLQLVQTQSADRTGRIQKQTILLLIASQAEQGDTLFAVKHNPRHERVFQLNDLTDRTELGVEEPRSGIAAQLWAQIQQGGGWFVRFAQRITVIPQVYAGVVYVTSADISAVRPDCSLPEQTDSTLHALHLHHAGAVYARRFWQVTTTLVGELMLTKNTEDELELQLKNDEQQENLLTELLGITEECANCTAALSAGQFPRIIRLATFQIEQGAQ